jgi:SAM-dependent methyltransferase
VSEEELVGSQIFDEDYLPFYDELLEGRSDSEVERILQLLDLPEGAEVLDVPCGHGRIANRLARRGLRVIGIDRSAHFLDVARSRASEAGVSVEYLEGDMRELPFEGRFDAVVNWFTSFGYFDDDTNRRVLAGFRRALRPGGRLLLEQASREFLLANLPRHGGPAVILTERGDDLMIDKVTFDLAAGRSHTERIMVRDGRVRRTEFSLSQPTASQLVEWLHDAGFGEVETLDESGELFGPHSRRLVIRCSITR